MLEKLARDKHSSLLQTFVNYSRKLFYNIWPWPDVKVFGQDGNVSKFLAWPNFFENILKKLLHRYFIFGSLQFRQREGSMAEKVRLS